MKVCKCEEIYTDDLVPEMKLLRHTVCDGLYDPAAEIVHNQRNTPAGPHMPNVEYRDAEL